MLEADYRSQIQTLFDRIEKALDSIDPDLVECDQSLGAMTLTLGNGSRCILSAQPSVRQLWLALASLGIAHHFNFDPSSGLWKDDKGKGIEIVEFLENFLREAAKVSVRI